MLDWKTKRTKVYMAPPTMGKTYFCNNNKDRVYNGDCFMIKYGYDEEIEELKGKYSQQKENWEEKFVKEVTEVIKSGKYDIVMLGLPNQGKLDLIHNQTKEISDWTIILPTPPLETEEDIDYLIQRAYSRGNSDQWVENYRKKVFKYFQLLKDFATNNALNIKYIEKGKYISDIADELF